MSEFKANKAKASSSNLALSAFAYGVSITFQLLLSTKLRNPTPLFPHFNNLYLIEVANRHRLTTSETNQYFMICKTDMKTLKTIWAVLVLLLSATMARAQYQQVNDISYTQSSDAYAQERCKLDVYYPTEQKNAPVVVWFHGGGIEGGNKHIDQQLRNSGLVVVAANYRLLPKAPIDSILDDAAAAVAWTYRNIGKYNGSRRKIFVAGHSAGGYLLDMIGLDKRWLAKYGVDADSLAGLVSFSGQCITHYNIRKQQGIPPLQATIDRYAPLTYVRPDAPPIVIISGDRELELYGRYEEQAYFWRMLKLVGHQDVTLYEMQGYDHGAMPQPAYKILKDHIKRITSALP